MITPVIGTAEAVPYDFNRPYVGRLSWGCPSHGLSCAAERFMRLVDIEYLVDTETSERFLM
jgi:hypothetical protein